jgi:hypothetical protein
MASMSRLKSFTPVAKFAETSMFKSMNVKLCFTNSFTPGAESHGFELWINAPALGREVAPFGRQSVAMGFPRGASQAKPMTF